MFYQINKDFLINIHEIISISKYNNNTNTYKIVTKDNMSEIISANEYTGLVKYLISKDLLTEK